MKKLVIGIIIGALGLFAWQRGHHPPPSATAAPDDTEIRSVEQPSNATPAVEHDARFHCDGRVYCSQMTSCEEATFFLRNCPGVKMDGEGDGVPCERQWCRQQ
jgi:hypothetical protein